ncbi:Sushi, nidogen and EGF-like domain-containing protein 1 [Exaiptasia diaphana]|nr:Sushi, nidogen and EGF-like domain-containing protein 1 [Exaiptasia diaphana]
MTASVKMAKISNTFLFVLLQIFLFRPSSSADLHELIPFGANNGDILIGSGDDSTNSGKVPITTGFRFFGRDFTSLYVNINGVITFKKPFSKYVPKRFPVDDTVMIAPFWTDVDARKGGAIWYRQITTKHVLKVGSTDVRKAFPEFPQFYARWMFVATWEKVPFHGTKHKCGFNAGFGSYSHNLTDNGYRNISVLLDLPFKTNVNKSGIWMFRTDKTKIQESHHPITRVPQPLPSASSKFTPFGKDNGDTVVQLPRKKADSGMIHISTSFPMLDKRFSALRES